VLRSIDTERLSEQLVVHLPSKLHRKHPKQEVRKSSRTRKERFNTQIELLVCGKGKG
jgi:hypothetical protein